MSAELPDRRSGLDRRTRRWHRGRRRAQDPGPEQQLALAELRTARLADLLLKIEPLLVRARRSDADDERDQRVARMLWVLDHGRSALQRVAQERP